MQPPGESDPLNLRFRKVYLANIADKMIDELWAHLKAMEDERRFDCKPYPTGMCSFPFKLTGQGFFPGGDGLWRNDTQLGQESSGALSVGGIIFLGNDFGTLRTYQKLHSKGYENPPTWRHLKERIRRAGLPEDRIFCTNAILGLRTGDTVTALDQIAWPKGSPFAAFCHEFLIYQVETLRPRLLVILGSVALSSLGAMGAILKERGTFKATIGRHTTAIHYSSHPYGDFNFTDQRRSTDALALRNAWDKAIQMFSQ